ncbi:unnamed protein product [Brachionus calyciflorus]|uniref:Uncharacterized protein n=1 Tax=Brachionus calyciflorus TaxID=104777 RepID=A0A814KCR5_9BILA|nr:unnamed protein product [Brachionus calyciflorus]
MNNIAIIFMVIGMACDDINTRHDDFKLLQLRFSSLSYVHLFSLINLLTRTVLLTIAVFQMPRFGALLAQFF